MIYRCSRREIVLIFSLFLLVSCGSGGGGTTEPAIVSSSLNVSPSSIEFTSQDQAAQVNVISNSNWTVKISSDWLTATPISGTKNGVISISANDNQQSQIRQGEITISTDSITKIISIVQEAKDESPYDIAPDASGMRDFNSLAFSQLLGYGFNIGNSLEAVGGETAWGNPMITQNLMDAIKAAGFSAIRLPVAWSQFSDSDNYIIKEQWLNRVKQVVDYAYNSDLYVVMNMHWDGGWMQPTYAAQTEVQKRMRAMWQQIARYFRDYDDHLLFAGTNEVMVDGDYNPPTEEYYTVQNSYNQTFVDTVRATGGRNVYRQLVVQGFNTNIDHTINFAVMPQDSTAERLLMEVHFYDPYTFTLDENNTITQWGMNATDPSKTAQWGDEAFVDSQFDKMQAKYVDHGIGVIVGEFAAISRLEYPEHEAFRIDWNRYVTGSALRHGLIPFYWDNGATGDHAMGIFNRNDGSQAFPKIIEAVSGN